MYLPSIWSSIQDEGHMSYACPKNILGDREPPPKKEKKKKQAGDEFVDL